MGTEAWAGEETPVTPETRGRKAALRSRPADLGGPRRGTPPHATHLQAVVLRLQRVVAEAGAQLRGARGQRRYPWQSREGGALAPRQPLAGPDGARLPAAPPPQR